MSARKGKVVAYSTPIVAEEQRDSARALATRLAEALRRERDEGAAHYYFADDALAAYDAAAKEWKP